MRPAPPAFESRRGSTMEHKSGPMSGPFWIGFILVMLGIGFLLGGALVGIHHETVSALDRQETTLGASFRTADGGVR